MKGHERSEYVVLLEKKKGHYRAVVPALPDCEDWFTS
jgi:hypothetical protein